MFVAVRWFKEAVWLDLESGDTDHRHRALPKQSRARHEKAMLCRTVTDIVNGDMRYSLSKQQKKRSAEKAGSDYTAALPMWHVPG